MKVKKGICLLELFSIFLGREEQILLLMRLFCVQVAYIRKFPPLFAAHHNARRLPFSFTNRNLYHHNFHHCVSEIPNANLTKP